MNDGADSAPGIWMQQDTQGFRLSPGEMRRRIERSRLRLRRRSTICIVTAGVTLITAAAILLFYDTPAVVWLRAIQVIGWVVLLTIGPRLYLERTQFLSLGLVSTPVPCLAFYREELERQRDALRPVPWLMTLISVFGLALAVFAPKHRSLVVPLGLFMVLIAIAGYARMRWAAPKLQMELDDLHRYERGPQG